MRLMRFFILILLLLPLPLKAEEIVLGLSQDQVAITATFDGSDILIFGAVKREAPAPEGSPLHVIISVSGPLTPVIVRRMDRRAGIWVNTDAVDVSAAPSFYAVATTAPLTEVLRDTDDLRYRVSIPRMIRAIGATVTDSAEFIDALIRIRVDEELYQVLEGQVELSQETLFRTSITLPSDLIEGNYTTRILLTRDGHVIDNYETVIGVQKVGLERFLYNLAHEQAFIYGLLTIAIAIAAGWSASAAFAALRR